jgi:hypothetical protein
VVDFPTRIHKNSGSIIDHIFIDNTRINSFNVSSIINGLSNHHTQYLVLKNTFLVKRGIQSRHRKRLDNQNSITDFLEVLKNET